MRLDHFALRTKNRKKTAQLIQDLLGYKVQTEFNLEFDDGSIAQCIALEPPEKIPNAKWYFSSHLVPFQIFHCPPEIFVSDGDPDSIVGKWVEKRNGGEGGIHHIAYMVPAVEEIVQDWTKRGIEFSSAEPLKCKDGSLTQIFTEPIPEMGNIIIELINRIKQGFCEENVKDLMESTKDN